MRPGYEDFCEECGFRITGADDGYVWHDCEHADECDHADKQPYVDVDFHNDVARELRLYGK